MMVTAINATQVTIAGPMAPRTLTVERRNTGVSPTVSTSYTATATGAGGKVSASATVTVTAATKTIKSISVSPSNSQHRGWEYAAIHRDGDLQ